jgi:hypothetical protein
MLEIWDIFYNLIRYKTFLLAAHQTILLGSTICGKSLVRVESRPPWTRVTVQRYFSFHFSVGTNCTICGGPIPLSPSKESCRLSIEMFFLSL